MKTHTGDIWFEEVNGTVNIGFNRAFIEQVLTECFHITQAAALVLTKGRPMLTVETNDELKVIRSPVTGTVLGFDTTARDFPDTLTEDTIVLRVKPKNIVAAGTSRVSAEIKEKARQIRMREDLNYLNIYNNNTNVIRDDFEDL